MSEMAQRRRRRRHFQRGAKDAAYAAKLAASSSTPPPSSFCGDAAAAGVSDNDVDEEETEETKSGLDFKTEPNVFSSSSSSSGTTPSHGQLIKKEEEEKKSSSAQQHSSDTITTTTTSWSCSSSGRTRLRKRNEQQISNPPPPAPASSKKKKKEPTKWECSACTLMNSNRRKKCEVCNAPKPPLAEKNRNDAAATTSTTVVVMEGKEDDVKEHERELQDEQRVDATTTTTDHNSLSSSSSPFSSAESKSTTTTPTPPPPTSKATSSKPKKETQSVKQWIKHRHRQQKRKRKREKSHFPSPTPLLAPPKEEEEEESTMMLLQKEEEECRESRVYIKVEGSVWKEEGGSELWANVVYASKRLKLLQQIESREKETRKNETSSSSSSLLLSDAAHTKQKHDKEWFKESHTTTQPMKNCCNYEEKNNNNDNDNDNYAELLHDKVTTALLDGAKKEKLIEKAKEEEEEEDMFTETPFKVAKSPLPTTTATPATKDVQNQHTPNKVTNTSYEELQNDCNFDIEKHDKEEEEEEEEEEQMFTEVTFKVAKPRDHNRATTGCSTLPNQKKISPPFSCAFPSVSSSSSSANACVTTPLSSSSTNEAEIKVGCKGGIISSGLTKRRIGDGSTVTQKIGEISKYDIVAKDAKVGKDENERSDKTKKEKVTNASEQRDGGDTTFLSAPIFNPSSSSPPPTPPSFSKLEGTKNNTENDQNNLLSSASKSSSSSSSCKDAEINNHRVTISKKTKDESSEIIQKDSTIATTKDSTLQEMSRDGCCSTNEANSSARSVWNVPSNAAAAARSVSSVVPLRITFPSQEEEEDMNDGGGVCDEYGGLMMKDSKRNAPLKSVDDDRIGTAQDEKEQTINATLMEKEKKTGMTNNDCPSPREGLPGSIQSSKIQTDKVETSQNNSFQSLKASKKDDFSTSLLSQPKRSKTTPTQEGQHLPKCAPSSNRTTTRTKTTTTTNFLSTPLLTQKDPTQHHTPFSQLSQQSTSCFDDGMLLLNPMTQSGLAFEYGGVMTQDQEQQRNMSFYSQAQRGMTQDQEQRNMCFYSQVQRSESSSQRESEDDDDDAEKSPVMDPVKIGGRLLISESRRILEDDTACSQLDCRNDTLPSASATALSPAPKTTSITTAIPEAVNRTGNESSSNDTSTKQREPMNETMPMFRTAGKGTSISISEESIAKANSLFEMDDTSKRKKHAERKAMPFLAKENGSNVSVAGGKDDLKPTTVGSILGEAKPKGTMRNAPVPSTTPMFRTAGKGCAISISEESTAKANKLLGISSGEEDPKPANISTLPVFKTAGKGNTISISEEDMAKANKLFGTSSTADQPKNAQKNAVPMFKTAGKGNAISISDESMAKANKLFSTSNLGDTVGAVKNYAMPAFQTVGKGKTISISEEAMTKAKKIFGTVDTEHHTKPIQTNETPTFHTAGKRKPISVSAESMAKANSLFGTSNGGDGATPAESTQMPMFQTAGRGKTISISEESMAKANKLFSTPKVADQRRPIQGKAMPVFQTAGKGNVISISEESMAKANKLFGAPNDKTDLNTTRNDKMSTCQTNKTAAGTEREERTIKANEFSGASSSIRNGLASVKNSTAPMFQTAGKRKPISVSEESLARANKLFGAAAAGDGLDHVKNSTMPLFCTTGEGKTISLSEESMAKANKLFSAPIDRDGAVTPAKSTAVPIFQTAGTGNTISLSEEGMAKANKLLGASTSKKDPAPVKHNTVPMFTTAGKGNPISISEESMLKANELFGTYDEGDGVVTPAKGATMPMFQTAGKGSMVSVSEESMAKANKLFATSTDRIGADAAKSCAVPIFQTAGKGNTLSVSEEAMAKANKLFCNSAGIGNKHPTKRDSMSMFQTAGQGKSILASDESMAKANELFGASAGGEGADPLKSGAANECSKGGIDKANKIFRASDAFSRQKSDQTNPMPMFKTAGKGTSISISEESLAKASDLFGASRETDQPQNKSKSEGRPHEVPVASETAENCLTDQSMHNSSGLSAIKTPLSSKCNNRQGFPHPSMSHTPKHAPQTRAHAAVTRSTNMKNPYARKRSRGDYSGDNTITPIPFKFNHIEGTFRGRKISPCSLAKAAKVLLPRSLDKTPSSQQGAPRTAVQSPTQSAVSRSLDYEYSDIKSKTKCIQGRYTLSEFALRHGPLQDDPVVCRKNGVHHLTIKVDPGNASKLRFDSESGLPCMFFGQSCVPGVKAIGKVAEICAALTARGCNKSLLSNKWISNHYRWIIWKLASMERRFPNALGGVYLTYSHVVSQLAARFEKEFTKAKRPAVRMVLNRDIASSRLMILCVSQVMQFRASNSAPPATNSAREPTDTIKLELTDGWYSVPAVLDDILVSFVRRGKIRVGSKLLISNATLLGAEDGIDPLDSNYCSSRRDCPVALRLVANATRLANWDAKLGFVRLSKRICSHEGTLLVRSLSDVVPGGGNIPMMDLVICRQYPKLFLEQGGGNRVLSEAEEELCRKDFDKKRQLAIEKIMESAEKECAKEVEEEAPLEWKKMMSSYSPSDYYEKLPKDGQRIIDVWKEKRSVMMQDMTRKSVDLTLQGDPSLARSSIPFVRILVKAYRNDSDANQRKPAVENGAESITGKNGAILTIWRVSEEQRNLIKEGCVVRVKNLAVKSTLHDGLLQLSANSKTQMQEHPLPPAQQELLFSGYKKRAHLSMVRIHILSKKCLNSPAALLSTREVDTAGYIINIVRKRRGLSDVVLIYLSDESGLILRLEREVEDSDKWIKLIQEGGNNMVIAFRDVRILRFDTEENAAVAVWTKSSSFYTKNSCPRIRALQSWCESSSGKRCPGNFISALRAGIPVTNRYPSPYSIAIGYILRFERKDISADAVISDSLPNPTCNSLQLLIDCGGRVPVGAEFPLFLLDTVLHSCYHNDRKTVDNESELIEAGNQEPLDFPFDIDLGPDQIDSTLSDLTELCCQKGIIFHFVLQKTKPSNRISNTSRSEDGTLFEVKHIKRADVRALSTLYMVQSAGIAAKN